LASNGTDPVRSKFCSK